MTKHSTESLEALAARDPDEWPRHAREVIKRGLRGPEAERALNLTTAVMDDELGQIVIEILDDAAQSVAVRRAAADALGPILEACWEGGWEDGPETLTRARFDRARKILRRIFDDETAAEALRQAALEALVHAPEDWQVPVVRAAWEKPEWKVVSAFAMQFQDGYEDLVLQALQSKDQDILRWGAASAVRVPEAWEPVAALTTAADTPKLVRLAAIESVANLRPEEAATVLGPLVDHENSEVAEAADEAIGLAADYLAVESPAPARAPGQQAVSTKVGRNESCPCGSGKKYKKCCAS